MPQKQQLPWQKWCDMTVAFINVFVHTMQQHATLFLSVRWGFIVTFVLLWPAVVALTGRRFSASPQKISYWKKEIFCVTAWLIVYELIVCENIFLTLIKLMGV